MKTILIVEDDRPLSQGIQMALRQSDREIRLAHTLAAARDALAAGSVDLVILDVNLPDGSGLALLEELRRTSDLPVLILSANDMEMDQVAGLELGADDYVTKPFSLAILRARVGNLLRQRRGGAAVELPPFSFDFQNLLFTRDGEAVELSKTEQRLLRLLVENRGRTLPREVLLDRVWDGGTFVDENSLSVAVKRLRDKLGEAPIRTVYGVGYTWSEDK